EKRAARGYFLPASTGPKPGSVRPLGNVVGMPLGIGGSPLGKMLGMLRPLGSAKGAPASLAGAAPPSASFTACAPPAACAGCAGCSGAMVALGCGVAAVAAL